MSRTDRPVTESLGLCPFNSNYSKGCRCDVCRARATLYNKRYRRNVAERSWGVVVSTTRVDPEPAVKAIWDAHSVQGISLAEIARTCQITPQTAQDLFHQERRWITQDVLDRVVSKYGPDGHYERAPTPNQLVDWQPHIWKLHCLYAQGWSIKELQQICKAAGKTHGWIHGHMSNKLQVRYESVMALDWLVEKIEDRHSTSLVNKARMTRRGIFPLIHYTEEGALIRGSLTKEQREAWRNRVQ